tara:strand:+ start:795 stop:1619 length:825 start_codon:yes stop_codon:yes gene_type:complete
MFQQFRTEISFKNIEQMNKKIEFCYRNNLHKINIPCKGNIKKEFLLEVVEYIGRNHTHLDVIYHYSFYHQYFKNKKNSYEYFLKFIDKCNYFNNNEILLVSGSNKRKGFDVIDVLKDMKFDFNSKIKFGVVFNPYLSLIDEIKEERKRLIEKLSSGIINSVWLQLGSDFKLLEESILFLKNSSMNKYFCNNKEIKLYGSLFVPSRQSLARFKFRPWKGVYFSDKYLNSMEKANYITTEILKVYQKHKLELLVESECSSNLQLKNARKILKDSWI